MITGVEDTNGGPLPAADCAAWTTAMRAVADGAVGATENPLPAGMTFFSNPKWMLFLIDACPEAAQLHRVADWLLERFPLAELMTDREWGKNYVTVHCNLVGTEAATAFLLRHLHASDPIDRLRCLSSAVLIHVVRAFPGEYDQLVWTALVTCHVPLMRELLDAGNTVQATQLDAISFVRANEAFEEMQDFLRQRGYDL